jgi:hypothetical protein
MFERLLSAYRVTDRLAAAANTDVEQGTLAELFNTLGGATLANGLYRVHTASTAAQANRFVAAAFTEFGSSVACFGFDWLGRQFSLDFSSSAAEASIVLFEPGMGEALEIPVAYSSFHDAELVDNAEAALARSSFERWGAPVPFDKCVGYKIPLFLGGEDEFSNLEVIDTDVYWTVVGQLRCGTLDLPRGTTVSSISRASGQPDP